MPLLPAAIGIVLTDDRTQVLLVKRKDVPVWVLPGGGVDPGETPEEALVREIWEESGFQIEIIKKSAEYTPINRLSAFTTLFLCSIVSGSPHLSEETADVSFFPLSQLPNTFLPLHVGWLKEILKTDEMIQRPLIEVSYFALFQYFIKNPLLVIRYAYTRWKSKN